MKTHPSHTLPTLSPSDAWALVHEPVDAIVPIGQGTRSRVYRLELRDGTTRVVKLLPRGSGRAPREAWVRARVGRDPRVPVTHEVVVHHAALARQADVTVMGELPGETMLAALAHAPPALAADLWAQFGAGLAAFHDVTVQGFGLLDGAGRGPHATWREAVAALAEEALKDARSSPLVDLAAGAAARLEALAPALDDVREARLLHGDAWPGNVQVAGGKIVAWFDFEFAKGGDPRYELAHVAAAFEPARWPGAAPDALAAQREAFVRGYAAQRPWPAPAPACEQAYRIVHALRSAEYLRVAAPALPPAQLAMAVEIRRAALTRALAG